MKIYSQLRIIQENRLRIEERLQDHFRIWDTLMHVNNFGNSFKYNDHLTNKL